MADEQEVTSKRSWKNQPPTNKQEALEMWRDFAEQAMSNTRAKYGPAFSGHVEVRGDSIVLVWDDGQEDMYKTKVEFVQ